MSTRKAFQCHALIPSPCFTRLHRHLGGGFELALALVEIEPEFISRFTVLIGRTEDQLEVHGVGGLFDEEGFAREFGFTRGLVFEVDWAEGFFEPRMMAGDDGDVALVGLGRGNKSFENVVWFWHGSEN